MRVGRYSPGWFHPGATRPNFNTVDVRNTQELIYAKYQYVTSDLNPGVVFLGRDLEFNSMTKFFYVNRSLPKHRLSEAEMLEINRLYRIIGRCQNEIGRLQSPPEVETAASNASDKGATSNPRHVLASIQSIPQRTRLLYGGIAIGALLVLVSVLKFARNRSG